MAGCTNCKWWMSFRRVCLLGRAPEKCSITTARRGDDEFVARMVDIPATGFARLRRRFRREPPKTITAKPDNDWE